MGHSQSHSWVPHKIYISILWIYLYSFLWGSGGLYTPIVTGALSWLLPFVSPKNTLRLISAIIVSSSHLPPLQKPPFLSCTFGICSSRTALTRTADRPSRCRGSAAPKVHFCHGHSSQRWDHRQEIPSPRLKTPVPPGLCFPVTPQLPLTSQSPGFHPLGLAENPW